MSTQSHHSVIPMSTQSELNINLELDKTLYNCKYCKNEFKTRQSNTE